MPEENKEEAVSSPSGGKKLSPMVIVIAVIAIGGGAAAGVLVFSKKPPKSIVQEAQNESHPSKWLDLPPIEIKDIPLSISLVSSGSQRKPLTVGVTVRFAPTSDEADPKLLEKDFIPRVTRLTADFRHIVIEEMNTKDYGKLDSAEVRDQLLKTFRSRFNDELKRYGLDKQATVQKVIWRDFFWN
jgi:flagellar basal body-associated protein FliL